MPAPKKPRSHKGRKVPRAGDGRKLKLDGTPSKQGDGGGPPLGTANNEKFKTREERAIVFRDLLKHLEQGLDQDSFEHCSWEAVKTMLARHPDECPAEDIARAKRRGHAAIEKILISGALGKIKGQAACAIFLAKNKIGYRDRIDLQHGDPNGQPMPAPTMIAVTAGTIAEVVKKLKDEF